MHSRVYVPAGDCQSLESVDRPLAPGQGRVARFCAVNVGMTRTPWPCQGAL
jgi:hypothetical protein